MKTPITNRQRLDYGIRHNDSDLARVSDVLQYYGKFSRACAEDLAILIKQARANPKEEE